MSYKNYRKIRTIIFIFIICVIFSNRAYAFTTNYEATTISLDVTSEDVKNVFKQIASLCGANIVVDDTLTSRVTICVNNIPYEQAIDVISKISGAAYSYENGVYVIQNLRNIYM